MAKTTLEEEHCKKLNLRYPEYLKFIGEYHPGIDDDIVLKQKYPTDTQWAHYKVELYDTDRFKFMVDYAIETKSTDILPQN